MSKQALRWNHCISATPYSVAVDTPIKWLNTQNFLSERLSISQGIEKLPAFFCLHFQHIWNCYLLNLFYYIGSCQRLGPLFQVFCIIDTINSSILYQDMCDLDLPWVPINISMASIKFSNVDDFLPFHKERQSLDVITPFINLSGQSSLVALYIDMK